MPLPDRRDSSLAKSYQTNQPNLSYSTYLVKLRRISNSCIFSSIRGPHRFCRLRPSSPHQPKTRDGALAMVAARGIKRASREHKRSLNGTSNPYQVASHMRRGESGEYSGHFARIKRHHQGVISTPFACLAHIVGEYCSDIDGIQGQNDDT